MASVVRRVRKNLDPVAVDMAREAVEAGKLARWLMLGRRLARALPVPVDEAADKEG